MAVHYQIEGRTAAALVASVESGVRSGALAPGDGLPAVRALAERLGVAPATVAAAYRVLRDRGLVVTAGRHGTRIRPRPAVATSRSRHRPEIPPGAVDLAGGGPDHRLLPDLRPQLRRLAATLGGPRPAPESGGYDSAGPLPDLVHRARERLSADGVPVRNAAITVTGGALDAIERVLGAHLGTGDAVAVEDPGWSNLLDLIAAMGLRPVPVAVDGEGPVPGALAAALAAGTRAVVVTGRAHNPTGATVTSARATALRGELRRFPEVIVIEDDHAAELAEAPLHPLSGGRRHWAFIRSVSKPYGPDLRLAVCAGDEVTIGRVEGRIRLGPGWVSTLLQRLVLQLWDDPSVADALAVARDSYRDRRVALCAALARHGVPATGRTGINVWVPVPDEATAVTRLRDAGFVVAPGAWYRLSSPPGIRITISGLDLGDVDRLAIAVSRAVTDGSGRAGTV